jgi:uncharacterized protein YndB with AHSA1/START domain
MSTPFRISHSFKVSRDTLWAVYTQPEHLSKWFGPQGFTMPAYDMEFRVGGAFLHALQAPDGTQMWGKWEFLGIDAPRRLSVIQHFSDQAGGVTRHPMSPGWPLVPVASANSVSPSAMVCTGSMLRARPLWAMVASFWHCDLVSRASVAMMPMVVAMPDISAAGNWPSHSAAIVSSGVRPSSASTMWFNNMVSVLVLASLGNRTRSMIWPRAASHTRNSFNNPDAVKI